MTLEDLSVVFVALELEPLVLLPEIQGVLLVLLLSFFVPLLNGVKVVEHWLLGQVLYLLKWDIRCLLLYLEDGSLESGSAHLTQLTPGLESTISSTNLN